MNTVTEKRDPAKTSADEGRLIPPVDVVEDATGITLYADLPGVPKDRVQVRIDGEQLTLEGEMNIPLPEGLAPTHVEVQRARYHRAFTLSRELDADKMSAEMSQGVLRLRIPKAAHAQPRRVEVKVA